MAGLAINHHLWPGGLGISAPNEPLQPQHDGTSGIDQAYATSRCRGIGRGRFAVGTQQDLAFAKRRKGGVVDGDESQALEAVTLAAVVDDVAKTIERAAAGEFFLGLAYGRGDAETEA